MLYDGYLSHDLSSRGMTTNECSDDDDAEHRLPKVMIYHHSDQLELISCFTEGLLLWIVRKDMGLYKSSRNRFVGQRWSHCMRRIFGWLVGGIWRVTRGKSSSRERLFSVQPLISTSYPHILSCIVLYYE
jgi:hypothetical protein